MESRGFQLSFFLSFAFITFLCTQGQVSGDCPADGNVWMPFDKNCYHFIHEEGDIAKHYTIQKAKEMCKDFALLTVLSSEENDFIVENSQHVWKGSIDVWLGMYYDTDDDQFKWNDETALSYNNWEEGGMEDPEISLVDTCVTLHVISGNWENVSCSEEKGNGVVCKTAQKPDVQRIKNGNPLLSALVILSVIVILGVSAVFWFLQHRNGSGSSLLPSFEYHPPFRSPSADQTCLVEAEEFEEGS